MFVRDYCDLIGDHEGGVKAHTKLTNQLIAEIAILTGVNALHEGLGAGARDSPKRCHHFVTGQSNAVVRDCYCLGLLVDGNADGAIKGVAGFSCSQRLKFPFVDGI